MDLQVLSSLLPDRLAYPDPPLMFLSLQPMLRVEEADPESSHCVGLTYFGIEVSILIIISIVPRRLARSNIN